MEKSKQDSKELTLLFDVSIALNKSKHIKDVLRNILEMMDRYMGMDRGTITLLNKNKSEIFIEEAYGLSDEEKARGKYKVGEGIIGKVVKSGMSVYIPKISDEPQFLDRTQARKKINKQDVSFICIPIKHDKEVIGTLSVDRLYRNTLSFEDDIRLISIIGSMIAQALKVRQEEHEELERLQEENARLQSELQMKFNPSNMIGNGQAMQQVYKLITKVAPTSTPVLFIGEAGVGKELVAKTVHFNSQRSGKRFVEINLSAFPNKAIETELFGMENEANEANPVKIGLIEKANHGTIYLSEIADLSLSAQAKLLTFLQNGQLTRAGGNIAIEVDVRVLAGTNKNLERLVEEGKFMEELYYHLDVFPIYVIPLRERKSDIPLLIDHFIEKFNKQHTLDIKRISTAAIDMIMAYHWPGNVRELENCIERAMILANSDVIYGFHLPPTLQTPEATSSPERGPLQSVLNKVETELIQDNLKLTRGNVSQAAANLGITERVITQLIAKHKIDLNKYKVIK